MLLSEINKLFNIGELRSDGEFDDLSFIDVLENNNNLIFLSNHKYANYIDFDRVSCIITDIKTARDVQSIEKYGVIVCDNPRSLFYSFLDHYHRNIYNLESKKSSIHKRAMIADSAIISETNVVIEEETVIEDKVIIKNDVYIGRNCIIRSGSIIGTEGFEVFSDVNGIQRVLKHIGKVYIGNNVEIQSNNTISKGIMKNRDTIIEDEVKTDNLVHIAHGARVGEKTRIAACAMIAGSARIGKSVWIGPSSSISSGVKVGNNSFVTIGSVVTKDVPDNSKVSGNFAIDHDKFISHIRSIR